MVWTELLKALLFGVVEGITEWLPISSTGHMILLNAWVRLDVSDAFWSMFEVVIQLGAIMAVVLLFWKELWPLGREDSLNARPGGRAGIRIKGDRLRLWGQILIACIPAAVMGLAFHESFEALFYHETPVAIALIVFGIAFIVIEKYRDGRDPVICDISGLTWQHCLFIGCFQLIAAVFPGTSRSGATIVGALLLGVSRVTAAAFTFYLAVPVMFGASFLKILQFGVDLTMQERLTLLTGMLSAFVVSVAVIRFLMAYVRHHDFRGFGWYRIVLGLLVLLQGLSGQ